MNNEACFATQIPTDGSILVNQTNVNATVDQGEAALVPTISNCETSWCENGGNIIQNSVWYRFTAPPSGKVVVSTCGIAEFDTQLALYAASTCQEYSGYTLVAANDDGPADCITNYDSKMPVQGLIPGQNYFLLVDGWGGNVGIFGISVTAEAAPAPSNDEVCNAIPLPVNGVVQAGFNNLNATISNNESGIVPTSNSCATGWCENGNNAITNSVWFKFVAPASGKVEVSTCDLADFDTQLAVYSTTDCNNFLVYTLLGANDDGPSDCATNFDSKMTQENLTPGNTYYVIVDGWNATTGNFGIQLTEVLTSAIKDVVGAASALSISPNPTSGQVIVTLMDQDIDAFTLSDMTGKMVKTSVTDNPVQTLDLDLTTLPKGVYLLQVRSGNQLFSKKVVLQ